MQQLITTAMALLCDHSMSVDEYHALRKMVFRIGARRTTASFVARNLQCFFDDATEMPLKVFSSSGWSWMTGNVQD